MRLSKGDRTKGKHLVVPNPSLSLLPAQKVEKVKSLLHETQEESRAFNSRLDLLSFIPKLSYIFFGIRMIPNSKVILSKISPKNENISAGKTLGKLSVFGTEGSE